jgi:hypothetical protein
LRAKKTSNFIKKRTEEYDRINKIIFKSIGWILWILWIFI